RYENSGDCFRIEDPVLLAHRHFRADRWALQVVSNVRTPVYEYQVRDAAGVLRSVCYGDRDAVVDAVQDEFVCARAVGYRLQVEHHCRHRKVGRLAFGHPRAARVVPDRMEALGQAAIEVWKKGPLTLGVGHGRRGYIDHRAALACRRVSDTYAVARLCVLDVRLHCDGYSMCFPQS